MLDNIDETSIERHITAIQKRINDEIKNPIINKKRRNNYLKKLVDEIAFWKWQKEHPDKRKNINGITMENCPKCKGVLLREGYAARSLKKYICPSCNTYYVKTKDGSLDICEPNQSHRA